MDIVGRLKTLKLVYFSIIFFSSFVNALPNQTAVIKQLNSLISSGMLEKVHVLDNLNYYSKHFLFMEKIAQSSQIDDRQKRTMIHKRIQRLEKDLASEPFSVFPLFQNEVKPGMKTLKKHAADLDSKNKMSFKKMSELAKKTKLYLKDVASKI